MSVKQASVHAKWVIGKVIGNKMHKTAKVRVTRLVLDPYLLKYYNKRKTYFAHDALQQCTMGDIVLIKALPEPRSKHVKHELAEIVHKVGQVVDPLTGKRVAGKVFLEPLTDLGAREEEKETTAASLTEKLIELNINAASASGVSVPQPQIQSQNSNRDV
ncbi:small ribosomal subunit protein uS17m [Aplochiton taeniatus]